jgi:hypothetical protein
MAPRELSRGGRGREEHSGLTATLAPVSTATVTTPTASKPVELDLKPLRFGAAAMLGIAAIRPALPDAVPLGPPCPLRTLTGIPCPFCGMTRGVVALVHGHVSTAFSFNPGAFLIVAMALVLLVAWRWQRVRIPVWAVFVFFAVLWAYQLFKYSTGRPL